MGVCLVPGSVFAYGSVFSAWGQFHDERDKVKINKYVYFHCILIALTQTVLYVLGKKHFYTTCKFIFMIFGQFSTMRQKK